MALPDKRVCPKCRHENVADANKCVNCGSEMVGETTLWNSDSSPPDVRRPARPEREFEPGSLYLYIVGSENAEPMQLTGSGTLILGRRNTDGSAAPNLLDLGPYHAFSLGVSRQHARITLGDKDYKVEDLNSSNGTRLNGNRLDANREYPLRSGDHLQLGELLIFIYFS